MQQGTQFQPQEQLSNFMERRWKLRADAFFIRTSDGVELRNSKGSYRVQGKAAYALIDWIFQRFQTPASIGELCAGMPSERRSVIERQLETLAARGFLREVVLPPEPIPDWAEPFSDLIAFIEEFEDAPFSRFQEFREKQFLCAGRVHALRTVLETLALYGARKIEAVAPEGDAGLTEAIAALRDRITTAEFNLSTRKPQQDGDKDNIFLSGITEFDCALLADELDTLLACGHVYASLLQRRKPLSIIGYSGEVVVASPLFLPSSDFCWECMYRTIYHQPSHHPPQVPPPAALALAWNHVIHNVFCYYTGVDRRLLSHCAVVNCDSLNISTHLIARHPACRRHAMSAESTPSFTLGSDSDYIRPDLPDSDDPTESLKLQDRIISWSNQLTDSTTGPFLVLEEGDLPQLALSMSRCVVRTFASVPGAIESREIVVAGISAREARNQVALFGLEYLADEVLEAKTSVACELLKRLQPSIDHDPDSIPTLGAGWSAAEAIYRALHRSALSWAMRTGFSQLRVEQVLPATAVIQYLASVAPKLSQAGLSVRVGRIPSGMAVAHLSTPGGEVVWGAGLNEVHACENAATELVIRQSEKENGAAILHSAFLQQEAGPWLDALQRNGITVPRHLDAGALLPICRGTAFLALVQV